MSDGITDANREMEDQSPTVPVPSSVDYGISIFELEDKQVVVHVTGDPDLGQLQRLLAGALANLNADITARKVMQAFQAEKQAQRIIRPGQ